MLVVLLGFLLTFSGISGGRYMEGINENTRGQDIPAKNLSAGRKRALSAKVRTLGAPQEVFAYGKKLIPYINPAIKKAEGNPRNFGVLSNRINSPAEANQDLDESIINNFVRWMAAGKPGTFIDFMRDRWAPIGAENDPKNLNPNWNNNVRKELKKRLGDKEYKNWERMNLVRAAQMQRTV